MPVRVYLLKCTVKVLDGVINRTHTYSTLDITATSRHKQSTVMEILLVTINQIKIKVSLLLKIKKSR